MKGYPQGARGPRGCATSCRVRLKGSSDATSSQARGALGFSSHLDLGFCTLSPGAGLPLDLGRVQPRGRRGGREGAAGLGSGGPAGARALLPALGPAVPAESGPHIHEGGPSLPSPRAGPGPQALPGTQREPRQSMPLGQPGTRARARPCAVQGSGPQDDTRRRPWPVRPRHDGCGIGTSDGQSWPPGMSTGTPARGREEGWLQAPHSELPEPLRLWASCPRGAVGTGAGAEPGAAGVPVLKGEERAATPLPWPVGLLAITKVLSPPRGRMDAPAVSSTGSASCRCRGPGLCRRGPGFACGCCDCLGSVATGKGIELLLEGLPHPWRDCPPPPPATCTAGAPGAGAQPLPPKWGAILRPTGPGGARVSRGGQ